MKSHSAPIQPIMNLDTAAKALNTQKRFEACGVLGGNMLQRLPAPEQEMVY